jgi:microcystin-dependent protein
MRVDDQLINAQVELLSADPTPGKKGRIFFNTATGQMKFDDGSAIQAFDSFNQTPSGVVSAYAGTSAPSGYLMCDGSAVSRATYAALFAVIGETHGQGDNATTFNVPDYRGRFLRGVDGGAAVDPDAASRTAMATGGNTGDNVGSVQSDATAKNGLTITDPGHAHTVPRNTVSDSGSFMIVTAGGATTSTATPPTNSNTTGITLDNGDNETRPVNAYVHYIIKT